VKEPAVAPAVYKPAEEPAEEPSEEMVPPVAVQVTEVFAAFVTVAVNCCVPLVKTLAVAGVMVTLTPCGAVIETVAVAFLVES
jgi:hypothetical protein